MVMLLITGAAMIAGGWSIQQAYACGPPDLMMSCLTVGDQLTAVILGSSSSTKGRNSARQPLSPWEAAPSPPPPGSGC